MGHPRLSGTSVNEIRERVPLIREDAMMKLAKSAAVFNESGGATTVESVADILERESKTLIEEWFIRVEKDPELMRISLSYEERTGHLPRLMHDVNVRLRQDNDKKAAISEAAAGHGDLRYKQGYPVEMLIEESRLLQVSIFTTLHNNVKNLEFSTLLPNVVTIADEVDAQLREQMKHFKAADAAEKAKGK
jgi:hypothetical protein